MKSKEKRKIIQEIDHAINDMKKLGYRMDRLVLILKIDIFNKKKYEYRGISIIYDENAEKVFEFKEARKRSRSYWM